MTPMAPRDYFDYWHDNDIWTSNFPLFSNLGSKKGFKKFNIDFRWSSRL